MNTIQCQQPSQQAQRWIVLIAVIQSILLLFAHSAIDNNDWLSATPFRLTTWYSLTLTVPTALMLLLTGQRAALSAMFGGAMLVVLGLQAYLAGNNCDPELAISCQPVLFPFGLSIAVICVLALPFLQAWQHSGRASGSYPLLFEYSWHNALSLFLAAAFLGLFWILLALWAGLFTLLSIEFFAELFSEKVFFYPVSGLVVGIGIAIARTRADLLANIRENSLFWIFRTLTPLLAGITLLFLAAIAVSGVDTLWATGTAGDLLTWLAVTLLVFTNAVFLNGETGSPYPRPIRWLVNAAICSLPVVVALGLWALNLRVMQYGWSVARLWALMVMLVLFLYGLGYALAVVRSGRNSSQSWLSTIKPHNTMMALVIISALCLINLGLPSFYQTATNSQLKRLANHEVTWQELDFKTLRFETGKQGYQAVKNFLAKPPVELSEHGKQYLSELLASNSPWETKATPRSRDELIAAVTFRDGESPPPELLDYLIEQYYGFNHCQDEETRCALVQVTLRRNGEPSWLFMRHAEHEEDWRLFEIKDGEWQQIAQLGNYGARPLSAYQSIVDKRYEIAEPAWLDLKIGDRQFGVKD